LDSSLRGSGLTAGSGAGRWQWAHRPANGDNLVTRKSAL